MSIYHEINKHDIEENDPQKLQDLQCVYEEAANDLCLGVASIGSLMFWAAASEEYSAETAKEDMYRLGAMLSVMSDVIRGFEDVAGEVQFVRSRIEGQAKK